VDRTRAGVGLFRSKYYFLRSTALFFRHAAENSDLAVVQAPDQTGEHPGDLFEVRLERVVIVARQQLSSTSQLQQRYALLHGTARDPEEVSPICLCGAAISSGDVGRDRASGPIQLVKKKAVTTLEPLGMGADLVREVDGLLVDQEFLEVERHGALLLSRPRK
jgi:hypothetical protein